VKVEKLAKNGEKGQNCYPLSPGKNLLWMITDSDTGKQTMMFSAENGFHGRIMCLK